MNYIQENSKSIIAQLSFKAKSDAGYGDYFGAFISIWISFNAYCYAKYSDKANILNPNLKKKTT